MSAETSEVSAETSFGTHPVDNGGEEVRGSAGTLWPGQSHPSRPTRTQRGRPGTLRDGRADPETRWVTVSAKTPKKMSFGTHHRISRQKANYMDNLSVKVLVPSFLR